MSIYSFSRGGGSTSPTRMRAGMDDDRIRLQCVLEEQELERCFKVRIEGRRHTKRPRESSGQSREIRRMIERARRKEAVVGNDNVRIPASIVSGLLEEVWGWDASIFQIARERSWEPLSADNIMLVTR